jgi:hypothetical protein
MLEESDKMIESEILTAKSIVRYPIFSFVDNHYSEESENTIVLEQEIYYIN